jgi:outer membrane receptor protein involved in Fe transport
MKIIRKLIGNLVFYLLLTPAVDAADSALESELKWLQAERVVEIVSKRGENINSAAGIVSLMTSNDIERYNAKNLHQLLNRVTSIYTLGSAVFPDNTVSMRGDVTTHHSNHILVLINGRPVRDSYTGGLNSGIYRDFPIHAIERLEIIRGPGSVLYGSNAYSGVISIVTKKNKPNSVTVRGGYGSFNNGRTEAEIAWKNEQLAVTGAVRYSGSDGWLYSATGEDKLPHSFRANENDISGTFWGEWNGITLNGFMSNHKINHWGALLIGDGQSIEDEKLFLDLGYKKKFNSHWSSQWNLTYNRIFKDFVVNIPNQSYQLRLSANDLLLENTHWVSLWDDKVNIVLGGLVEWQNESLGPVYNHLKASLYGELSIQLLDNLKLNAGGQWNRLERSLLATVQDNAVIEGKVRRLGLVYQPTQELGFKLLYSQAFRDPSAVEMTTGGTIIILNGNQNLKAERVDTLDAQIFYHAATYSLALTAFKSTQKNLIERVLGQYRNESHKVIFEGLEFESEFKPSKALQFTAAYTFQTNHDKKGYNNDTPVPNHLAKLGVSYDLTPEFQLSVFDTFFSQPKAMPETLAVNPPANSYHNLTVNSRYRLDRLLNFSQTKHITFSLYLDNLLDEHIYYPEIANRKINAVPAMPGRTVMGELAIEF